VDWKTSSHDDLKGGGCTQSGMVLRRRTGKDEFLKRISRQKGGSKKKKTEIIFPGNKKKRSLTRGKVQLESIRKRDALSGTGILYAKGGTLLRDREEKAV